MTYVVYDHEALLKAYPTEIAEITDGESGERGVGGGIWDQEGNPFVPDEAKVAAARAELDGVSYRNERKYKYPPIGDQLDDLYKQGLFSSDMANKLKAVKDEYPKPS